MSKKCVGHTFIWTADVIGAKRSSSGHWMTDNVEMILIELPQLPLSQSTLGREDRKTIYVAHSNHPNCKTGLLIRDWYWPETQAFATRLE